MTANVHPACVACRRYWIALGVAGVVVAGVTVARTWFAPLVATIVSRAAQFDLLTIAMATLVSEDLTCLAVGHLIGSGDLSPAVGIAGCAGGIYLGDLLLFAIGHALARCAMPKVRLPAVSRALERNLPTAIIASRFIPGTRVPLYLAAGGLSRSAARFALWTLIAVLLWTPAIVLLAAGFGQLVAPARLLRPVTPGAAWVALVAGVLISLAVLKLATRSVTLSGRASLIAAVSRLWRWEFWPGWLFYLPIAPYLAWLAIRHGGLARITAANPGIPHGGFIGESKFDILAALPAAQVIPTAPLQPAPVDVRLAALQQAMLALTIDFPIVLKPDVGQRGEGVKLVRSLGDARQYLEQAPGRLIVQKYHPGPFEAGVFYYRHPGHRRGRILSITDKCFPQVIGDGELSIESLIWKHPRLRMQARTFLARLGEAAARIPARGECVPLAIAGNHCQGTMFRDGAQLITPKLTRAIDRIAKHFDGFHFGRFDLRYTDPQRFKAGEEFAIIELNGVTSESTNLYDPSWSILRAYRTLARQWRIVFAIALANEQRGFRSSSARQLLRETFQYYRARRRPLLAD